MYNRNRMAKKIIGATLAFIMTFSFGTGSPIMAQEKDSVYLFNVTSDKIGSYDNKGIIEEKIDPVTAGATIIEIGGNDTVDDDYTITASTLEFDTAEGPFFRINYISKTLLYCTSDGASLISCNVTDDFIEVTVTSEEYSGNHTYRFPKPVEKITEIGGSDTVDDGYIISENILDFDTAEGPSFTINYISKTIVNCTSKGASLISCNVTDDYIEVTVTSDEYPGNHTYRFELKNKDDKEDTNDKVDYYEIDEENGILEFDTENGPYFKIDYRNKRLIDSSTLVGTAQVLDCNVTGNKLTVTVTSGEYPGEHTYSFKLDTTNELQGVKITEIKKESNKIYLTATPIPETVKDVTYTWRSSDESRATVEDGVVTLLTDQCDGIQIYVTASAPNSKAIISTSYIIKSNGHSVDPGPDPGDYEENYNGWKYRIDEDYVFFYKYIGNSTTISVPATANIGGKEYKVAIDGTGEGYYRPEADNPSERYDSEGNGTFPMNTKSITIAEGVELRNPRALFSGLKSLETVSIGGWTGIAADEYNCEEMFAGCTKLKNVDMSKCPMIFESLRYMFFDCSSIESIDISGLMGSKNDRPMGEEERDYGSDEFDGLLQGCDNLRRISPFTNVWHLDISEVDQQYPLRMNLVTENGENRPLSTWQVSKSAHCIFYRVYSDDAWRYAILDEKTALLIGMETDAKGIRIPSQVTVGGNKYNTRITGNFEFAESVETVSFAQGVKAMPSLGGLFSGLSKLKTVEFAGLDTSATYNFAHMFSDCSALESIDLSNLDTSGILTSSINWKTTGYDPDDVGMSHMFSGCTSLRNVTFGNSFKLGSASNMFSSCTALTELDLSNVDTSFIGSRIIISDNEYAYYGSMSSMFEGCSSLKNIKFVRGFKLASNMSRMFYGCGSITQIDLSKCDDFCLSRAKMTEIGGSDTVDDGYVISANTLEFDTAEGPAFTINYISKTIVECSSDGASLISCNVTDDYIEVTVTSDEYPGNHTYIFPKNIAETGNDIAVEMMEDSTEYNIDELFSGCTSLEKINISSILVLSQMGTSDIFKNCSSLKILQSPKKEAGTEIEFPHTLYDTSGKAYTGLSSDMVVANSILLTDGTVPVEVIPVESVALSPSTLKLKIGDSSVLTPQITPADATNQNVSWFSSNDSTASVDQFGRVTGKARGIATITVTTEDGNKTAVCRVIVSETGSDNSGSGRDPGLNAAETETKDGVHYYDAYMVKGQTYVFPAKYGDIDASSSKKDQDIAWKTSNKKIASVSGKTKVKAANSTGSTSTVQIYDGATFASSEYVYRLHIVDPMIVEYGKTTLLKSITLTAGDDCTFAVAGLTGYEDKFNVTWLSSNNEIASVDNGIVSAVMNGSAKITAYVGGKAYACTVKVVDTRTIPKKIEDESTITLSPLQTVSLKFSSTLFKAKNLEWISADGTLKPYNKNNTVAASTDKVSYFQNEVIRVTPAGKVTAVGVGSTTISATDQNGITQTVTITIPQPVSQTLSLNVNKTKQIKLYNVNAGKATWSSSDSRITGNIVKGKIQGVRYGTAEATCTYDPYNTGKPFEYKIMIYVENPKLDTKDSTKWSKVNAANTSGTLTLKVGDTYKVSLTDVYQDVVFTSNKPTVAFVDESGNISVRDAGKAKLTAKVNGTSITINIVSTK